MMKLYTPDNILIDRDAKDYPLTSQILRRCPDVPVRVVSDIREWKVSNSRRKDPIGTGKKTLYLAHDKGRSFKPFPESHNYLSCDYYTLHLAEGCDLECSYCILQSYLTNPLLTVFVNVEEALANLRKILNQNPDKFFRIGTGQLADSLSLDHLTEVSKILVPFFAPQTNAVLELKTKSVNIENLKGLVSGGNTIVSWSMNSKKIQRQEEHKCASIEDRLASAKQLAAWGFQIGFHFDPIIDYEGWEKDYEEVIDLTLTEIPAGKIAWISLGCLRMMPALKNVMRDRFPKSPLPRAEWIKGMDGKLRYFKPRRVEIYKEAVTMIRKRSSEIAVYLCMESPEVWKHVFAKEATKESVCALLDGAGKSSQDAGNMPHVISHG